MTRPFPTPNAAPKLNGTAHVEPAASNLQAKAAGRLMAALVELALAGEPFHFEATVAGKRVLVEIGAADSPAPDRATVAPLSSLSAIPAESVSIKDFHHLTSAQRKILKSAIQHQAELPAPRKKVIAWSGLRPNSHSRAAISALLAGRYLMPCFEGIELGPGADVIIDPERRK